MSKAQPDSSPVEQSPLGPEPPTDPWTAEPHEAPTVRAIPRPANRGRAGGGADRRARPAAPAHLLERLTRPSVPAPAIPESEPAIPSSSLAEPSAAALDSARSYSLAELRHSLDPMFLPEPPDGAPPPVVEEDPPATTKRGLRLDPSAASPFEDGVDSWAHAEAPESPLGPADEGGEALCTSAPETDFFRYPSFPPVVEDFELGPEEPADDEPTTPTPEQLVRRRRLRKAVGTIVALTAASALVALVVSSLGFGSTVPEATGQNRAPAVRAAPLRAVAPGRQVAAPSPAQQQVRTPSPASDEPPSGAERSSPSAVAALRAATVELLTAGQFEEAAESARRLIDAEPESAFGYRCLGAALQDLGRWAQAHQVYGQCVQRADRGDVGECAALGGKR